MKKIVVISDNHMNMDVVKNILYKHQDADNYFHLGDSECYAKELNPFISIMGNNDFDYELPQDRVIDIGSNSFYLTHGHIYSLDYELMAKTAKANGCNVVLFGHSHEYVDRVFNSIRFINPGSCRYNRYGKPASYAVITIDDRENLNVEKVEIVD